MTSSDDVMTVSLKIRPDARSHSDSANMSSSSSASKSSSAHEQSELEKRKENCSLNVKIFVENLCGLQQHITDELRPRERTKARLELKPFLRDQFRLIQNQVKLTTMTPEAIQKAEQKAVTAAYIKENARIAKKRAAEEGEEEGEEEERSAARNLTKKQLTEQLGHLQKEKVTLLNKYQIKAADLVNANKQNEELKQQVKNLVEEKEALIPLTDGSSPHKRSRTATTPNTRVSRSRAKAFDKLDIGELEREQKRLLATAEELQVQREQNENRAALVNEQLAYLNNN